MVPVKDQNGLVVLDNDEYIRGDATMEALGSLKPAFTMIGEMGGFDAVALQKYQWFWIEDGDWQAQRALTAVMFFFTLAETGDTGKLPLITIPAQ